ncbi:MAG TPA: squalene synthase HpnC, partial [Magnetospirillum sp.]|nr:squalene synthase HpnC [Magnetospirillum sp.]
ATTGKTAAEENFPVASFLLPAATRRQVMAFYHFARTADDIADDPTLSADAKLARLDALEEALIHRRDASGTETALNLCEAVADNEALLGHAAQLLQAFRRDAVVDHCRDWGDLMMYCRFSAAPVGRFLLQLHDESADTFGPSDSLCAALQVLNHLQDCADDLGALGRVYIPRDWLRSAGLTHDVLAEERTPAALRQVFDITLDHVDGLIDLARPLPRRIADRRLRLQAAITLVVAERLSARLRRHDPLVRKVKLSPLDYAGAVLSGLVRGWKG